MGDPTEVRMTSSTGGQKGQKLCRMDLIPPRPLWKIGEHYGLGAKKYDDRNWERGYEWSLSLAALKRHLNLWEQGELVDDEGFEHLTAAAWHLLALMEFSETHPEFDDVHSTPEPMRPIAKSTGIAFAPGITSPDYTPPEKTTCWWCGNDNPSDPVVAPALHATGFLFFCTQAHLDLYNAWKVR